VNSILSTFVKIWLGIFVIDIPSACHFLPLQSNDPENRTGILLYVRRHQKLWFPP